jgi:hypothetical protein
MMPPCEGRCSPGALGTRDTILALLFLLAKHISRDPPVASVYSTVVEFEHHELAIIIDNRLGRSGLVKRDVQRVGIARPFEHLSRRNGIC